jgi:putative tricarboxylic transport membrane protein
MQIFSGTGPGAGFFPMVSGVLLGIFSAIWLFQERVQPAMSDGNGVAIGALVRVGLQLAAFCAFAILLEPAGYLVSAAVLSVTTAVIAGERNLLAILLVAIAASFGVSLMFASLGTTI